MADSTDAKVSVEIFKGAENLIDVSLMTTAAPEKKRFSFAGFSPPEQVMCKLLINKLPFKYHFRNFCAGGKKHA